MPKLPGGKRHFVLDVSLSLTVAERDAANEIAKRRGIPRTEAIRQAITHAHTCPLFLDDGSTDRMVRPTQQG